MKFIKLLFIFTFVILCETVFCQNFVDSPEALIRLELHQSEKSTELSGGVISETEYQIVENFIIDLVRYISEDVDVPESLNASFETMLNMFQNDQEMVVTVRDNIQTALIKD